MTTDLLRRVQDAEGPDDALNTLCEKAGGWAVFDPAYSYSGAIPLVLQRFPNVTLELVLAPHGCSARIICGDIDVTDARLDQHLPLAIIAAWLKAKEAVAETTKDTRNV